MRDWGCDVYVLGILFDSDFDFDSDSGFQRVCVLYVHGSPFLISLEEFAFCPWARLIATAFFLDW